MTLARPQGLRAGATSQGFRSATQTRAGLKPPSMFSKGSSTSAISLPGAPSQQFSRYQQAYRGRVPAHAAVAMSATEQDKDAPIKLGVNGFGRIGRQVVRIAMDRDEFVLKHINSPMSPEYMKYLLEHDTVHGRFKGTCELSDSSGGGLIINGM